MIKKINKKGGNIFPTINGSQTSEVNIISKKDEKMSDDFLLSSEE